VIADRIVALCLQFQWSGIFGTALWKTEVAAWGGGFNTCTPMNKCITYRILPWSVRDSPSPCSNVSTVVCHLFRLSDNDQCL